MTAMKSGLLVLLVAGLVAAEPDSLMIFGHSWDVPVKSDWTIGEDAGAPMLHMVQPRGPLPGPRRPIQFALLQMKPASKVKVDLDVRPLKRSCIIVFAYGDAAHFDYAHLSTDTGTKQPVHNGIFHVYGGERVRISSPQGPAAFTSSNRWYHVALSFDGSSGEVNVTVDGKPIPALRAVDLSLSGGRVGIGSFDETGDYKNVKVEAATP
jgi:hypothetical protein